MCIFHSGASANRDSNVKVKINPELLCFSAVFHPSSQMIFPDIYRFIFEDIILCVSSSLQFRGSQKMSRVCDLHLSRFCGGPQTRCEQMCRYCTFSFTSLLAVFVEVQHVIVILALHSHVHDSSVNPRIRQPRPHRDVGSHVKSCTRPRRCSDLEIGGGGAAGGGADKRGN